MSRLSSLLFLVFASQLHQQAAAQASTGMLPDTAPATWQEGQTGTNHCGNGHSQVSMCQNLYINGVDDFCLWGPPKAGPNSDVAHTERDLVSWCMKGGYGTRLIPAAAITGAHFIETPDFVQVTGTANLSMIHIPAKDDGLDPHGADGRGNPLGGVVYSKAFGGTTQQIPEWTLFIGGDQFCFRACKPGPDAARWCQHIYDTLGCAWNMPAEYSAGFDTCKADSGEPAGEYSGSTFIPGETATPSAHPRPSQSSCTSISLSTAGVTALLTASASVQTPLSTSVRSSGLNGTGVLSVGLPLNTLGAGSQAGISAASRTGVMGWGHAMFAAGMLAFVGAISL